MDETSLEATEQALYDLKLMNEKVQKDIENITQIVTELRDGLAVALHSLGPVVEQMQPMLKMLGISTDG